MVGNGKRISRCSLYIMDSDLYHSVLSDPDIMRFKENVDLDIIKSQKIKTFPVVPDIEERSLSVSFPQGARSYKRYQIETAEERISVGYAYAVQSVGRSCKRGLITIFLFEHPVFIFTEDLSSLSKTEVWLRGELIGSITKTKKREFRLVSRRGDVDVSYDGRDVLVECGEECYRFGLQVMNKISNILNTIFRGINTNDNFIYQPKIKCCDPVVLMGFLLAFRMFYHLSDF